MIRKTEVKIAVVMFFVTLGSIVVGFWFFYPEWNGFDIVESTGLNLKSTITTQHPCAAEFDKTISRLEKILEIGKTSTNVAIALGKNDISIEAATEIGTLFKEIDGISEKMESLNCEVSRDDWMTDERLGKSLRLAKDFSDLAKWN